MENQYWAILLTFLYAVLRVVVGLDAKQNRESFAELKEQLKELSGDLVVLKSHVDDLLFHEVETRVTREDRREK